MDLDSFTEWAGSLQNIPDILDDVPLPIAIIDKDLQVRAGNKEFAAALDNDLESLPRLVLQNHSQPYIIKKIKLALAGETADISELAIEAKSGIKYFDIRLFPIVAHNGDHFAACVGNEVTEQVARRQQQLDVEQLITISELVNVVAHELNNPLAAVLGFSQLLSKDNLDATAAQDADRIHESAEECKSIVDKLLVYARKQQPTSEELNVNDLIARTAAKLAADLENDRINLQVKLPSEPLLAKADHRYLRIVLRNLIDNARLAMPAGGTLSLSASVAAKEPPVDDIPAQYASSDEGEYIEVCVEDTGTGIAEGIAPYVFEPFFTTRPGGVAAGTGMSICRSIIRKHGGRIYTKQSSSEGTTIAFQLPIHKPAPEAAKEGAKHVLLVDDDLACCRLLAATLSREGHLVDCAYNGTEALIKVSSQHYDVIIADVKMPYMNGIEFFNTITRNEPAYREKVIFVTGDVMGTDTRDFLKKAGVPHLMKPFDVDEVNRMVRRMPK